MREARSDKAEIMKGYISSAKPTIKAKETSKSAKKIKHVGERTLDGSQVNSRIRGSGVQTKCR